MKPGYKTTEFYVTVATILGSLVSAISGNLPDKYAGLVAAITSVGYAISRGFTKGLASKPPASGP